ncbi:hypothetical protein BX666DRAFT_2022600 [Dichotomocladium elegans]|nr:hypothetical protein BX666DRAFT_2022600 [Dichotomocladium elegans]
MDDQRRPPNSPDLLIQRYDSSVLHLQGLPTLDQVLRRQTFPPVCLYNYYIVLRDRLGLEPLLDFWLDVQQAIVLHKSYCKKQQQQQQKSVISPNSTSDLMSSTYDHQLTESLLLLSQLRQQQTTKPTITRDAMVDLLEKIHLRYIVPCAEKELVQLPMPLRDAISDYFNHNRTDDPEVFAAAQAYVYGLLESVTYPHFIRYKVTMNLTLYQQLGRIVAGLIALLVGFSVEFSLIFLNIRPWPCRLWGVLPIFFGVYCLITSLTGTDPIWVLVFNISETTTFRFNPIQQPQVRPVLVRRSIAILSTCLIITLVLAIIFCAVPGKRL